MSPAPAPAPTPIKLSPALDQLQTGILKVIAAKTPQPDPTKFVMIYSKGVLASENLLNNTVWWA